MTISYLKANLKAATHPHRVSSGLILITLFTISAAASVFATPREVRVGVYANEPKILLDDEGQIAGIFGDLITDIVKQENWTLKLVLCDWDECLHALQDGRIDLMPDIAYSDERAKSIDFHTIPVLHSWSVIYHREGTTINSMLDLQGKRIAILKNSIQEAYLKVLLADFGVQAKMIPVHTLDEVFEFVTTNEADVAVTNRFFGEIKAPLYKLLPSPIVYQPTQLFFGTQHGQHADVLAAIDQHLAVWINQANSPYFKALKKWTGQPTQTVIPDWLLFGSGALAALLLLTLLLSIYLRRMVNEKNRHLQAEQDALAKSEQKLRSILDNVDAYIYLKDKQGCYLFANKLTLELFAVKMEDMVGFGDEKFFNAATADNIRRNDRRVLVDGEVLTTEEPNTVASTGKTAVYLSTKLPLRAQDGSIYALCGISIDISARKQTEEELRKSKEMLQLFIEHAPASLAMFDRDMRYLAVSRRWLADYSLGEKSIVGRSHYEIFPEISATWKAIHQRGLAGEIIKTDEDHFERADGSTQWLQWEVRPWKQADGTVGGIVIFTVDITQYKRATEELELYQRHLEELVTERTAALTIAKAAAESAYIAKSTFLANMSHEIRTPLNAITGTAFLMRRTGVTPQQSAQLDIIDNAGQHLLDIINSVLDLSKIEAGKFELDEQKINTATITNNVVAMLAERAHKKNIKLIIETVSIPLLLLGDPTRLQQALLNYVTNAIKFTDSGSIILRTLLVEESADSACIRFEVQDTGIGIAPDVAERLFNSFEQGDNSMTRKYGGTGLGLAITKKLALLMGGDAGVISTPGTGSIFWFTAQLKKDISTATADVTVQPESSETTLKRDYKASRILITDDEPFNRTLIQDILAIFEPKIDLAENGVEALNLVRNNTYDLILMDMQMPEMNGLDATREIRTLPNGATVPIIALTGNAFSEDMAQCMEAGMNDFLTKPFNIKKLFATLLQWLSTNKSLKDDFRPGAR